MSKAESNTTHSTHKEWTGQMSVSEHATRMVVNKDLKPNSRARSKRCFITDLSFMKKGLPFIVFFDEKLFTVNFMFNSRTDRYVSPKRPICS